MAKQHSHHTVPLLGIGTSVPATAAAPAQVSAVPVHAGFAGDSVEEVPVVALAERVRDFNISIDPWEQTGAAPQGCYLTTGVLQTLLKNLI